MYVRQVEEVTFELEQYKQENRELQNQLALGQEAQETLATQLDETGHILDEANAEIRQKEEEVGGLQAVLAGKEQEMEELRTQRERNTPSVSLPLSTMCVYTFYSC